MQVLQELERPEPFSLQGWAASKLDPFVQQLQDQSLQDDAEGRPVNGAPDRIQTPSRHMKCTAQANYSSLTEMQGATDAHRLEDPSPSSGAGRQDAHPSTVGTAECSGDEKSLASDQDTIVKATQPGQNVSQQGPAFERPATLEGKLSGGNVWNTRKRKEGMPVATASSAGARSVFRSTQNAKENAASHAKKPCGPAEIPHQLVEARSREGSGQDTALLDAKEPCKVSATCTDTNMQSRHQSTAKWRRKGHKPGGVLDLFGKAAQRMMQP